MKKTIHKGQSASDQLENELKKQGTNPVSVAAQLEDEKSRLGFKNSSVTEQLQNEHERLSSSEPTAQEPMSGTEFFFKNIGIGMIFSFPFYAGGMASKLGTPLMLLFYPFMYPVGNILVLPLAHLTRHPASMAIGYGFYIILLVCLSISRGKILYNLKRLMTITTILNVVGCMILFLKIK